MNVVSRPVLRWHGGKWILAPWIIEHMPVHRCYVEAFGGAASVLLRKERSHTEVYNDIDQDVVNLFRVLRDRTSALALQRQLQLTPFARVEHEQAYEEENDDPIERARRLVIRSFMGFGSNGHNIGRKTGFRAASRQSGTTPARDWKNYTEVLDAVIDRMLGVVVESRPGLEVMKAHDSPETVHYVDPPYLPETRKAEAYRMYAHEMSEADHKELLVGLSELKGMIVLSGYPSTLYDIALWDWRRVERRAHADRASDRTEVLWLNRAAASRLQGVLL